MRMTPPLSEIQLKHDIFNNVTLIYLEFSAFIIIDPPLYDDEQLMKDIFFRMTFEISSLI